jgi:hypothetical protein
MKRFIAATTLAALAVLAPLEARAFCGFYVAKADAKLFNKASKVVVARKDTRTTITMASDYQGDPKEFALVIPVPTVIAKDQIKISDNALVDHLDAYSAPRLVEYHDPDPCAVNLQTRFSMRGNAAAPAALMDVTKAPTPAALGVKIEAEYTVGEYDIAILSAKESGGLTTYLNQEGYKIPAGAAPVLASYIKQDMKFFVARVNLKEQAKAGATYLRPIQVTTDTPKFMLPIRLGTVNANGPQDMIVLMLTEKGRVETTNYRTHKIPSNMDVPLFTKNEFGNFYRAMFAEQVRRDGGKAVYLEYAWDISMNASKCDPCAAPPVPVATLSALGADWPTGAIVQVPATDNGGVTTWRMPAPSTYAAFITRLHVRYDAAHFPEDLMFQETADRANYQGRYVLRHPYTGKPTCQQGEDYARTLPLRFATEATTLQHLTGWDIATIKQKMGATGQPTEVR